MKLLIERTQEEIRRAYQSYCNDTSESKTIYFDIINSLTKKDIMSCDALYNEGILNYNQMVLIMCWVRFERYIKEIATSLFKCKGEEILKTNSNDGDINKKIRERCKAIQEKKISFFDLYDQSQGFTNISGIKERVFNDIANEAGKGQADISTYISFIRLFIPEKNPYDCEYFFDGDSKHCDYYLINAIREIRNTLIHDGGIIKEEKKKAISKYKEFNDNIIHIDTQLLNEIWIIIETVSKNIFTLITDDLQEANNKEELRDLWEQEAFYKEVREDYKRQEEELKREINDINCILNSIEQEINEWYDKNVEHDNDVFPDQ